MTSDTIISRKALASPRLTIAGSLVRALYPWMGVVSADDLADPSDFFRTGPE